MTSPAVEGLAGIPGVTKTPEAQTEFEPQLDLKVDVTVTEPLASLRLFPHLLQKMR